jgi:hypothetical protein
MISQRLLSITGVIAAAASGACSSSSNDPAPDAEPMPALMHSCKELLDANPALDSGAYTLGTASDTPYQAYCDMEDDGGGWTLVLKIDGTVPDSQFDYDNPLWTNTMTINDQQVDVRRTEAKFRAFTEVGFSALRVVMTESHPVVMKIDAKATSFMTLMRGSFIGLTERRQDWMSLVPDATIQDRCNQSGINNFFTDPAVRVRIGLLASDEESCTSPSSFVGIGGGGGEGNTCYVGEGSAAPIHGPSAGAFGGKACDVGLSAISRPGFAYIFVR